MLLTHRLGAGEMEIKRLLTTSFMVLIKVVTCGRLCLAVGLLKVLQ